MRGGGGGGSSGKRASGKESAIHRVQEVPLPVVQLEREYAVRRVLGEGCFARVLLATHRRSGAAVVLKAVHAELTPLKDFYREFHYSYHLSAHPCVLSVYSVAFRADHCYVFAQEYASLGDLAGRVRAGGLPEEQVKRVAHQLAFALAFLHSHALVHRDLKLENVLVFADDLSRVKLCDFGETRRAGALVRKGRCTWQAFQPPEVVEVVENERYHCRCESDVWQLGVALLVCVGGCAPWRSADAFADASYAAFARWQRRRTTKLPPAFRRFTPRFLRLLRRLLDHKPDKRAPVEEVNKYLKDSWTTDGGGGGGAGGGGSSAADDAPAADEGKTHLRKLLSSYGLETTVDQKLISKRVWEWVLACEAGVEAGAGTGTVTETGPEGV